ncbi:MAG: WbqC family protein [Prevotella sp.]|jgi:hypothetical protein|nr:WbqC family protein [Prevotella sp.]
MVILSSTYFGPVQWYQKLCRHGHVAIERYDHFMKQTYRNRCVIAAANGPQALTVPVEKGETQPLLMKDVRISDHGNWRHLHWQALQSAYGESPFFEFYADDLRPFFEKRWTWLFDFNLDITQKMCELLDIQPTIELTSEFVPAAGNLGQPSLKDFRDAIHPKHPLPDSEFEPRRYYQVYESRHGFQPNLSILDLLFNMGNESVLYIQ